MRYKEYKKLQKDFAKFLMEEKGWSRDEFDFLNEKDGEDDSSRTSEAETEEC